MKSINDADQDSLACRLPLQFRLPLGEFVCVHFAILLNMRLFCSNYFVWKHCRLEKRLVRGMGHFMCTLHVTGASAHVVCAL